MLLKNSEDLRAFVPFTVATSFPLMDTYFERAVTDYVRPALGPEGWADVKAKYDANTTDAKYKELIRLLQGAIAWYGTRLYIPVGQLQISDAGVRINVNDEFKQAFEWQIDNLDESCANAADSYLEAALAYLEQEKATFTAWSTSTTYSESRQFFVNSATMLNDLAGVSLPRRIFRKVIPELRKIQFSDVYNAMGKDQYLELRTQWLAGNVTPNNKELLNFIQPAMAMLGIAKAVSSLTIEFSDLGITSSTNTILKQKIRQAADADMRSFFIREKQKDGMDYIAQLINYLYDNVDTYPLYKASSAYKGEERVSTIGNTSDSGFFAV